MAKLLRSLPLSARVYTGIRAGQDEEHGRQQLRIREGRAAETYEHDKRARERSGELAELEHQEKVESIQGERGARDAARGVTTGETVEAGDAGAERTLDLAGGDTAGEQPAAPNTLAAASGQSDGAGPAPAGAPGASTGGATDALWLRQARAQSDYWTKQGRPERAQKAIIDAYKGAFAESEARHRFEIQPKEQEIRNLNLTAEELAADQKASGLRKSSVTNQLSAAGTLWGLIKMGATREALDLFNSSSMLQPGVKAESIKTMKAKGPDGQIVDVMVLFDREGAPIKDKNGQELIYPVALLERMHRLATTSTVNLKRGESVYQLQQQPDGSTRAAAVVQAPNAADDRAAQTAENTRKDRLRSQARDAVKNQLFAGQTMMDKVDPHKQLVHGRAATIAERYVDSGMAPGDAASRAVKEVEDEIKRERASAGKKDGKGKATVKDIIGG